MATTEDVPALPFERTGILDIAPGYRALQAAGGLTRVRTPSGDLAWLALRHEDVRALMAIPALGRAHPDPPRAARFSGSAVVGRPVGSFETERADHSRMRIMLNRCFSVRRMEAMRPRVQALVDGLLDRMAAQEPPLDLHEAFSFPLPALVICEHLGVPFEDRERFRAWSEAASRLDDGNAAEAGQAALRSYMRDLVARKRREPADDVISELLQAGDGSRRMTEAELVPLVSGLLFAGHETTVARIDLGTLLLLTHPDQRRLLQRDPALVPGAVEEILRMAAPTLGVVPRFAGADIEIGGVKIEAGEMVLLGLEPANRDAGVFADPDRFDITRQPNPHVSFGYAHRFCLGAPLARIELQCVFGTLFRRLPSLRLAVPVEQLELRTHLLTGGLERLPVAW